MSSDRGRTTVAWPRRWREKFSQAAKGAIFAFGDQESFAIHLLIGASVLAVAGGLQVEPWRWAVLLLAISLVLALELINTSIEYLVRALHPDHHPALAHALDVAAGAVLVGAIGSVTVALVTLGPPLLNWFAS